MRLYREGSKSIGRGSKLLSYILDGKVYADKQSPTFTEPTFTEPGAAAPANPLRVPELPLRAL